MPYMRMENLHVYTADCYEELAWDVSLDEILSGMYGRMDERHPLRVVYIPGKSEPQVFPYYAFISPGLQELLKCDDSTFEETSSPSSRNFHNSISPPDEAPPSYQAALQG
jgi:hypothetical protein